MRFFFLALCLLAFLPAARAEEPLTWERSVQETARNNPDLSAAGYSVAAAWARVQGSRSPLLPQLSADASSEISDSSSESHSAGLSLKQTLFSGGRNRAGVEQSGAERAAEEARLSAVKSRVGSELKSAFAQLLFAQEQLALTEAIDRRRQENVDLLKLRYEAGREHQGSYLRIKASAAQARFEVAQAERSRRVGQRELGRVMGRKTPDGISVAGEFGVRPLAPLPDIGQAALQTPAHQEADAQAQAAGSGVKIAQSRYLPDVDAVGSAGFGSSNWPPDESEWSAGIEISFPFFSGGKEIFDVKEAQAEQARALANLRTVDGKTAAELESRFAALQDAVERVAVRREFLEAADLRAEIARAQYTTGLLSFEDWDIIENDLIDNQKTMLATLRDAVLAEAVWERALGKGPIT
ncbi:MAG: TolC family protein [Candidatus Omnitrophota bacterium]|nr:TolC family protein [Candidatus Omnitrophota bacterium]